MPNTEFPYNENYVKFFLHRNTIYQFDNIHEIEKLTFNDERIKKILDELTQWPCREIRTHKDVDHPLHKLSFLAELGMNKNDPTIELILNRIFKHQSEEGPFQVLINIPKHFGGSGQPMMSWVLSDAPVLLYAVIKLNNREINEKIKKGIEYIAGLISDNGWHCIAAKELGKFKGPGRKDDPCPYATLFSLKMLSLTSENDYKDEKRIGINTLLDLWDRRKETKPYLFGMGTDFKKLKLPFVWYDILNVVDTLSMYPQIFGDRRFIQWINIIKEKQTENGFIPESIYLKVKEWDFGQKKSTSEYMNAIIERIEKRINQGAG